MSRDNDIRPHRPLRTCMGCGARGEQRSLLRIGATASGGLRLRRRAADEVGRSGYLHCEPSCWERFAGRKGPVRALRRTVDRETRRALVASLARIEIESENRLEVR